MEILEVVLIPQALVLLMELVVAVVEQRQQVELQVLVFL